MGWLVIDNPSRRNALNLTMWTQLAQAAQQLNQDSSIRAVVVCGAADPDGAGDFSAGADISEFEATRSSADSAKAYDATNLAAFAALRSLSKPTVALIRGNCLGGGLGLALACDIRIAASTARFCLPPAKLGLAYPVEAIADVVAAIGPAWTKRLIFTGERIDAARALQIGLVQDVHPEADLVDALAALTNQIIANAPLSQTAGKLAVAASLAGTSPELLATAHSAARACYESRDFAEGRTAFLEKRTPVFTGE
ncbi:enoyl-CoA hydratase-related protein [Roseibium sp.]|uniref:enoyl-CoA hydratase-related protein n=1 Tax=Roseibium sp. TaxID=1936156 RepID=UPI003A9832CE